VSSAKQPWGFGRSPNSPHESFAKALLGMLGWDWKIGAGLDSGRGGWAGKAGWLAAPPPQGVVYWPLSKAMLPTRAMVGLQTGRWALGRGLKTS
jgi:hypothetical protein